MRFFIRLPFELLGIALIVFFFLFLKHLPVIIRSLRMYREAAIRHAQEIKPDPVVQKRQVEYAQRAYKDSLYGLIALSILSTASLVAGFCLLGSLFLSSRGRSILNFWKYILS